MMITVKNIYDEKDKVTDVLQEVMRKSDFHAKFIVQILERIEALTLDKLTEEKTELTITLENGNEVTKTYHLVKPLRKEPIHEVRYALSNNEHLRLLFFPFTHNEIDYYLFTHAYVKTQEPVFDPTDMHRDEAVEMYLSLKEDPEKTLNQGGA